MNKEQVLSTIDTKLRLKAEGYYFLSETGVCIENALKLTLTDDERLQINALKKDLNEVYLPHHTQFQSSNNEPVLVIMKKLESILKG